MTNRSKMTVAFVVLVAVAVWLALPVLRQAAQVSVVVPATYTQDRQVILAGEGVTSDLLQARAREVFKAQSGRSVLLSVARSVTVGDAVVLMDMLKAAGAEAVVLTSY